MPLSVFVSGASSTLFPIEVVVDSGGGVTDTLRLADHDDTATGNWITTTGSEGTIVQLPDPLIFKFDSNLQSKSFTYQGKDVTIDATSLSLPKTVTYPFTTHKVYNYPDNVDITFTSSSSYTGKTVELRLIEGTMTGLQNLVSESLNGDIEPLKAYLHDNEVPMAQTITHTLSGANSFSFSQDYESLNPGEYVAVVLNEEGYESNTYTLELYSMTPLIVFDYSLDVTPSYNGVTGDLETSVTIESASGSTYSYGIVLVKQDIYSLYTEINTDWTPSSLTVDVGVDSSTVYRVVENNQFLGLSLSEYSDALTQNFWQTFISDLETAGVISAGDMAFSAVIETSNDAETLVQNVDGFDGTYWLMTLVWEHGGGSLAGFDQQEVTISQAASITSLTSDAPKKFTEIVTLSYTVDSPDVMTGVKAKVSISQGETTLYTSDFSDPFDLSQGENELTYEWDPLRTLAVSGVSDGVTIDVTLSLEDSESQSIDDETVSVELTKSIRSDAWSRVVGVVSNWGVYSSEERPIEWSEIVVKVVSNWGLFSSS